MKNPNEQPQNFLELLIHAIANNDFNSACMLLHTTHTQPNPVINPNKMGDTLLVRALKGGCYRIAQLLIERGAIAGQLSYLGKNYINQAIYLAMAARAKPPANINKEDAKVAPELFLTLLERKTNINFCSKKGKSPLSVALQYCREPATFYVGRELVFLLTGHGATAACLKTPADHTLLTFLFNASTYKIVEIDSKPWLVEHILDEERIILQTQNLNLQVNKPHVNLVAAGIKLLPLPTIQPDYGYTLLTALIHNSYRHNWHTAPCVYLRMAIRCTVNTFEIKSTQESCVRELKTFESQNATYYGDDLSDDSDEEDNTRLIENSDEYFSEIKGLQKARGFWQATKRTTPQNKGLENKLVELVTKVKSAQIKDAYTVIAALKKIDTKTINPNTSERANFPYTTYRPITPTQFAAIEEINKLIREAQTKNGQYTEQNIRRISQLCEEHRIYVPQFRGLNYMVNRWNAPSRRYHYRMIETGQPQHCEMALRSLEFNMYRELNEQTDYTKNPENKMRCALIAQDIKKFIVDLRNHTMVTDYSDRSQNQPYLFNNLLDRLQHSYSNGVDEFLIELALLRKQFPNFWGSLPNARNPFVSTGSSPYHCFKYAYGIKKYYGDVADPRYRRSGRAEYPHLGKLYVMLYRFDELLFSSQANNVVHLDKCGRVRLERDIGPEKETSFLGTSSNIIFQIGARLPSFHIAWLPIHEIKYGLTKELYEAFQYLILNSIPNTPLRDAVIDLLQIWLSSYHEVLLNHYLCSKINGVLMFWGEDGTLTTEPSKGLFPSSDKHLPRRVEAHTQRKVRESIATSLLQNNSALKKRFNGFTLVDDTPVQRVIDNLDYSSVTANLRRIGDSYAAVNEDDIRQHSEKLKISMSPQKTQFLTPQQQHLFIGELSKKALSTSALHKPKLRAQKKLEFSHSANLLPIVCDDEHYFDKITKLSQTQLLLLGGGYFHLFDLPTHTKEHGERY
ncbi:MAG: hypothetical protein M3R00_01345 [Pseudomonadota bacterium]|nr:hypothetical protein [Pseudomonadota bacterium]